MIQLLATPHVSGYLRYQITRLAAEPCCQAYLAVKVDPWLDQDHPVFLGPELTARFIAAVSLLWNKRDDLPDFNNRYIIDLLRAESHQISGSCHLQLHRTVIEKQGETLHNWRTEPSGPECRNISPAASILLTSSLGK